ncbi:MAG TPA: FHA domain-containing protein [Gemmatimonadaceae bacterium]|nr:FHA domain-containing protein [Gemmatimonadaceae bacterium]
MTYLELNGTLKELGDGKLTVGSGAQATWRVTHHDLAARHFVVERDQADGIVLRPCSAQSIVVVNGRQVPMQELALHPGDVIAAGTARFRVVPNGDVPSTPLPEEPASAGHLIDERTMGAFPLSHRTTTIGRDTSSVIRLTNPRVSRFHADIRVEAGAFVLYPMGASGTAVNDERLSGPHVLREGDRITVGDATFCFTRAPLPADVHPADTELVLDDPQGLRATLLHGAVTTGEHASAERPSHIWLLAVVALGLAVLGYIIFL